MYVERSRLRRRGEQRPDRTSRRRSSRAQTRVGASSGRCGRRPSGCRDAILVHKRESYSAFSATRSGSRTSGTSPGAGTTSRRSPNAERARTAGRGTKQRIALVQFHACKQNKFGRSARTDKRGNETDRPRSTQSRIRWFERSTCAISRVCSSADLPT
jgi:hypothetical protein